MPELTLVPVGTIIAFALGVENIPAGWQLCDGRPVDRNTHLSQDHQMAKTPDLRGRTLIGASDKYTLGAAGGEETVTLTVEQIPAHDHEVKLPANCLGWDGPRANDLGHDGNHPKSWSTTKVGGGQPHNNMQPYQVVNYIIYTGGLVLA
jgi:microcystin-dependent protein